MRAYLLLAALGASGFLKAADRTIEAGARVNQIAFMSTRDTLAAFCDDGRVRLWNAATGQLLRTMDFDGESRGLTFSPDGHTLATIGQGDVVRTWTLKGPERLPATFVARLRSAQFSRDAALLAAGTGDQKVRLWDVRSGEERLALPGGIGGTSAIAFSPDGRLLVAADDDTNIRVWTTRDGELVRLIEELQLTTFSLAFSPDGRYLASGGADGVLRIWDTHTWKPVRSFSNQPESIMKLAFSPDGRLLATGGFDDTLSTNPVSVVIQDAASGKVVRAVKSPHRVTGLAFSADGKQFAVLSGNSKIAIWEVPQI